jgi:hypothetical protein
VLQKLRQLQVADKKVGSMVAETLGCFLTQKIVTELPTQRTAEAALALLDCAHSSHVRRIGAGQMAHNRDAQGREWNAQVRVAVTEFVAKEAEVLATFEDTWDGKDRWSPSRAAVLHSALGWQ